MPRALACGVVKWDELAGIAGDAAPPLQPARSDAKNTRLSTRGTRCAKAFMVMPPDHCKSYQRNAPDPARAGSNPFLLGTVTIIKKFIQSIAE